MANHVRKQLRDAVVSALTGLATTGTNVFGSRVRPLEDSAIPGLLVFLTDEDSQDVTVSDPVLQERLQEVRVEGYAKADTALDDTLDQIAKEVEVALSATLTIGGKKILLGYDGCSAELDEKGEEPTGSITLRFKAQVYTAAGIPDVFS